jgi:hypothetical protein
MADTKHGPAPHGPTSLSPVEGDGVHYGGIIWFMVIMAVTVLGSQLLVLGGFKWMQHESALADAPRSPLASSIGQLPPAPNLLYQASGSPELNEPGNLATFRAKEEAVLNGYSYDKSSGAARIPIEKAKELLLQRGLPSRDTSKPPAAPAKAEGKKQ